MKKVLVVYNTLKNGGVENVIMNITRNLSDKDIQFDLVTFDNAETEVYNDKFRAYGGKIYKVKTPQTGKAIVDRLLGGVPKFFGLLKLMKNNDYCAVHSHQSFESGIVMMAAAFAKVKVRITHSHFGGLAPGSKLDAIVRKFNRGLISKYATHKVACAENAYEWLYGDNNDKKVIIYNGIDVEKFKSDRVLDKNGIINFVNVGRYVESKNHMFLIDTFYELAKVRDNIRLTLIGYGELEKNIKKAITDKGLSDKVDMLPGNSDVAKILKEMDYSIFPSKREGFSVSLVEFQASNIPCFVSTNITRESNLGICSFLDLEKGPKFWADYVDDYIKNDNAVRNIDLKKIDNRVIAEEFIKIYTGKR